MQQGSTAKGLQFRLGKHRIRIWFSGVEVDSQGYGRLYLFPWNPYRLRMYRFRVMWWIAMKIPKQAALYAYVRVFALSGDGPEYNGEYVKGYDNWVKEYEIEE
jgi:hypothetical protein